jgi:hypothetical protein
LLPAFDSGEGTFWIGRPKRNETVDGQLQVEPPVPLLFGSLVDHLVGRSRIDCGTARPRALAVFTFKVISNLTGS